MLKQYLRTMPKPPVVKRRELPVYWYLAALLPVLPAWMSGRLLFGGIAAIAILGLLLAINETRLKPKRPEERIILESYKEARHLKDLAEHRNMAKWVEPRVLESLEEAASAYFGAVQQLSLLPASVDDIRTQSMEQASETLQTAFLIAKPFVRREDQARKEFEALGNSVHPIESALKSIGTQTEKLRAIEREIHVYMQNADAAGDLRQALRERRTAEAELEEALRGLS